MKKIYTLLFDGDDNEKHYYNLFIKDEFQSYEKHWQKYIVKLTTRPKGIHTKDNRALRRLGLGNKEVALAQLHYTVFIYLTKVYELKKIDPLTPDQFSAGLIQICTALDVADELLEKFTSTNVYDPWEWHDSDLARKRWRKTHKKLDYIRHYRNRMIHGAIIPSIIIYGTYKRYRIPRFKKEKKYIDWRKVTNASAGSGGRVRNNFDAPNNLLNQAWCETLKYLETNWKKYLL